MKSYERWQGIRGFFYEDRTSPDGKRWVAEKNDWKKVGEYNCWQARDACEACGKRLPVEFGDVHHRYGRGGGKREDRRIVCGHQYTIWLCRACHNKAVIERRLPHEHS